jgi:uncharacterized membrane protein YjgN (DUF898 family)
MTEQHHVAAEAGARVHNPTTEEPTPPPVANVQTLDLRFTGSGSEYFRIWIVNLLLTLVTLTLYWPFARARRIAYFQGNTLVGGDPLGFHADPWRMFRGYLVVLLLGLVYWGVSKFVPQLAWLPFVLLMLVWPLLWRASLQFRLHNTSWRGVRLAFEGDAKGAYLALLPLFVPGLVMVLAAPGLASGEPPNAAAARWVGAVVLGTLLVAALCFPWLMARLKRYQHSGFAFAGERTRLDVGVRPFYGLYLRTGLLALLVVAVVVALVLGAMVLLRGALGGGAVWLAVLPVVIAYILIPLVVMPYAVARSQNLVWSATRSDRVRLHSALRYRDLLVLNARNWLLIALTLGLYWPFAKVHSARLRLQACTVAVQGDVGDWVARAAAQRSGLLGDAAGDFFGLDVGL